ncbi:thioredoxin-like 1-2, chloroplastic [Arachis duranensis]|uniref:Thioredoxin-like 1-2, chloroplastic n=1 Tax=Arachis duranensis TaxID=130453 RepID=A0A6P4BZ42_ARADU|nr:thioredoxin-like 1-2, chloroplastic [Arachis duranensis]
MASSLNLKSVVVCVPENMVYSKGKPCPSSMRLAGKARSRALSAKFMGQPIIINTTKLQDETGLCSSKTSIHAEASICISRSMQWWKKNLKPNMIEIHSAQELLNSLLSAGDALVVVDFYSPACGGCRALHPKICQIAEMHPNAIFLKVNYDKLKTMCQALQIHVLPFFRFYRGAEGQLCGFSCTNATINKFKRALSKHGNERCSLRPPKGLDELELTNLVSSSQIWF